MGSWTFAWNPLTSHLHSTAAVPARPPPQVRQALGVALQAHSGQLRKSGEPFITHPVEVARILAEMRMDSESLIAGLLHDTVEDTDAVSFEQIERLFGRNVRRIVEGETKLSKVNDLASKYIICLISQAWHRTPTFCVKIGAAVSSVACALHRTAAARDGRQPPHPSPRLCSLIPRRSPRAPHPWTPRPTTRRPPTCSSCSWP